jgi:hypothetical protein
LLLAVRDAKPETGELATRLAECVLADLGGRLALDVLAGGPHTIANATRLAGLVLDNHAGSLARAKREA